MLDRQRGFRFPWLRSAAVALLCLSCASLPTYPRPMCLYDNTGHSSWRAGTAVTSRSDGSVLFVFDDQTEGDHGTFWFQPLRRDDSRLIDERGRELAPCHLVSSLFGPEVR